MIGLRGRDGDANSLYSVYIPKDLSNYFFRQINYHLKMPLIKLSSSDGKITKLVPIHDFESLKIQGEFCFGFFRVFMMI